MVLQHRHVVILGTRGSVPLLIDVTFPFVGQKQNERAQSCCPALNEVAVLPPSRMALAPALLFPLLHTVSGSISTDAVLRGQPACLPLVNAAFDFPFCSSVWFLPFIVIQVCVPVTQTDRLSKCHLITGLQNDLLK